MVPTFKEYVFDFQDLKLLGAVCGQCGAETILDVSDAHKKMPKFCPSCGNDFDTLYWQALQDFHAAYSRFTDKTTKAKARIRIRREVNVSEF